jgi:glycine/D-amino acid oxidase-like deaminating enzyme
VLHVESLAQVFDEIPGAKIVVNCTGLGAGKLAGDETCFPTLGQTVLVKGKAHRVVTRRNEQEEQPWEALVIPRPGENITVLGGCKVKGDWCTEPSDRMTATILERCKPLVPELLNEDGNFEVLDVRVGLRPSREGGPRVSMEPLEGGRYVVHNYGHNSAGFEGSVGSAEEATNLLLGLLD